MSVSGIIALFAVTFAVGGEGEPRIAADPAGVDFGTRGTHEVIEQTFVLRNDGDGELILGQTGAGCSCTAANLKGTRLMPGEAIPFHVRVPLAGRRGAHRVTVLVESNDPRRPRLELVVHGRISGDIDVRPAQVFLGPVERAGQPVRTLRIRWSRRAVHAVTEVESLSPWFSATLDPESGGRLWIVEITPCEIPPWGEVRGAVRIRTTHPGFPSIEIPVVAQVVPGPILWMPREISIPSDARDTPVSRHIIIRTTRAAAFSLTHIDVPHPLTAHAHPLPGGDGYRVQFDHVTTDPSLDGKSVHIITDIEELPVIEIPIRFANPGEAPDA